MSTKVSVSSLSGAEVSSTCDDCPAHLTLRLPHTVPQRLAQRAARFGGNTSLEAKKLARAERFVYNAVCMVCMDISVVQFVKVWHFP